jgi:hypothetical protein
MKLTIHQVGCLSFGIRVVFLRGGSLALAQDCSIESPARKTQIEQRVETQVQTGSFLNISGSPAPVAKSRGESHRVRRVFSCHLTRKFTSSRLNL